VKAGRFFGLSLPGWRLKAQLILPYVVLTLITAMVGLFVVTQLVAASVRDRFTNRINEASRVAADGVVRFEREQLEWLRRMAFTEGVAPAIVQGDPSALDTLIGPHVLNDQKEAVTIVNGQGREVMSFLLDPSLASYETTQGADLSGEPLVAKTLAGQPDSLGDKFAGLSSLPAGRFLFTTAPVPDAAGRVVGAVLVGTRLESLLNALEAEATLEGDLIMLGPDGKLLAATLVEPDEGFSQLELSSDDVARIEEKSESRTVTLNGRPYEVLYAPFKIREEKAGLLGVVLNREYVVSTEAASRNSFALIFALGVACVIVVGYMLAQSIARPILQLRQVSHAVASGDLNQRVGLKRPDEIGELASDFDVMTDRLRQRTEEAAHLYAVTVQRNKELAEINARLQSAQQQLIQSEKLAAVGQLTAGIVHDVKNPLAVIKGLAEILQEEEGLDTFVREQLTLIRDNASRANTIVTDLLKFARQSTPEMMRRDLRETVQSSARLTEYLARKGKVSLSTEVPDDSVMVMYDAQQIEQVLINLIQNAIQAMPNGGNLVVGLTLADGTAMVKVTDTGIGIPPENLTRVFDPFFTTKPEGEGTGLGLSVSYGIVRRHRGEIDVESVVGQGTTFVITLPVNQPEAHGQTGE
jgi:signal transduction histidine kinase